MRLTIHSRTVYRFNTPVTRSIQLLRMIPRSDCRQRVLQWNLELPAYATEQIDAFGNVTRLLSIEGRHEEVAIGVDGLVEISETAGALCADDRRFPSEIYLSKSSLTAVDEPLRRYAEGFRNLVSLNPVVGLQTIMEGIRGEVSYALETTRLRTSAVEAFSEGLADGQGYAHLFIACCRWLGIPARYVSGYIHTDAGAQTDTVLHSWAEAWIEELGWLSYDVANTQSAGKSHLRLAVGRDHLDAGPVRRVLLGDQNERRENHMKAMTAQQ